VDNFPAWHAAVPRVYKGPFDRIAVGVGPGCELDGATYTCKTGGTPKQCLMYSNQGTNGYNRFWLESMSLYDGELVPCVGCEAGACCKTDGVCVESVTLSACQVLGGIYRGDDSTCAQYPCCPTPFADADHDRDVDQEDFGAFQVCFTDSGGGVPAGCVCFDRDLDGDIDAADFTAFNRCWTGPNVKWIQLLTPNCSP
jgi:hypothetical protein